MLTFADNPPILADGIERISSLGDPWWVAHTRSRAEKALAWELQERSIPYFLPMAQKTVVWGGRKRQVLTPIFPSYVFFCGDAAQRQRALATNRICQVISVTQREQFVAELEAIHSALSSQCFLNLHPFAQVGRRCRVTSGPLEGIEGTVVQKNGATLLVLQISMLGQGASLEISADLLEPA